MIAQIESFEEEYKDLRANRAFSNKSLLLPLQPFLLEGVIGVGGRLNKAWIAFETKHQVILSPTHPLTRLLVQDLHGKHSHVGREHTLATVRQQYWIPRGKSFVRMIVNDCPHCKRRSANVLLMASLRKSDSPLMSLRSRTLAWTISVVMNVKRGRVTKKRWRCLFSTCVTIQAIHEELQQVT